MDRPLASPKVCRCCLSTDEVALRLMKGSGLILDLLVGKKLDLLELWLCYRCSHFVKKTCQFQDMCSRTYAMLQEYSILDSNVAGNFFLAKKETFNLERESELSISNTLCISIIGDKYNNQIHTESFNRNGKSPKNYTENITRYYEISSDGIVKLEKEFHNDSSDFEIPSEAYRQITWLKNVSDVKFENSISSPELNILLKTSEIPVEPTCEIEDSVKKCEAEKDINSYSDIPLHISYPQSDPIKFSSKCNSSLSKKEDLLCNTLASKPKHPSKNGSLKKKYPKMVADEIKKVFGSRLTLEEQMKEKEDRASEESYLYAAYKCDLCVVTFQSQLALVNHNKRHLESSGPLVCPVCSIRFPKYENLKYHKESHSIRFLCRLCEKRFYNRKTFISHLIWHSGEFKCPECSEIFTEKKKLREHTKKEHPIKVFECEICGKVISKKDSYLIHMQRHRGIPTQVCPICSKGFYAKPNLYLHLETHKENKQLHYCVECDRHFKTLNILNSHLMYSAAHRDSSILKFKCTQCPMAFYNSSLLSQHNTSKHGGAPKYVCDECGANYATRSGLIDHIKSIHQGHQAPKKFPCSHCEKAFTSKTILVNHIRVHTGERPFKCPHCLDTFKQKSTMGTHIKLVHLKLKRKQTNR